MPYRSSEEDNRERLLLLTQGINAGVWDWNIQTGEEWWSRKYFELLGYEPGEIPAEYQTFYSLLVHPDDAPRMDLAYYQHITAGEPYRVEIRLKHKDGHYSWFESQGQASFDGNGKPLRMVGVVIECNEKVLKRQENERYEFLLEQMSTMAKVGGWEYFINEPAPRWTIGTRAIHGVAHDFQPSLEDAINFYHESSRPRLTSLFNNCLKDGVPYDDFFQIVTAQGETRWTRVLSHPIYGPDGTIIGARGTIMDIHEQRLLELERAQTIDLLTAHNQRLQNFAHIVSHNLRSHAANVDTLTSLMEREDDPIELTQLIGMLRFTSTALLETLDHLNQVVKVQSRTQIQKTLVDLQAITQKTLRLLQVATGDADAIITQDFAALRHVMYDFSYAESLLLNLVSNAIKYRSPKRKCQIHISTMYDPTDNRPCLVVADNGLGMDMERVGKHIFGMYRTFHTNPEARGVGLYLTRNQVEVMGGNITVASKPDQGTTFTVKF